MSDYEIVAGATSQRIPVWLADSSSTTGEGLDGLAFNTASLSCYYWREDEGNAGATAVTLATATRGTWTSSGFVEKDATNMPGEYEFGIPNAAIASGAKWVKIMFKGAANLAPRTIMIRLLAVNPDDSVRMGLTALPNATAGANTGLPVVGTQVPNATAGAAGGLLISGSNSGTTTLAALTVTGATTLTGAITANNGANAITGVTASVTGTVTVGTNNDKTGYELSAAGVTAVQSGLATAAAVADLPTNAEAEAMLDDRGITEADGITRIAGVDLQQGGTGGQSVGA